MRFEASHVAPLSLCGGHVAASAPGYDGSLYVLICMGERDDDWFERKTECDWRVLEVAPEFQSEIIFQCQRTNFNIVQPYPWGLLLATSRCSFNGGNPRPNAHILDESGALRNNLLLGDGIEHLQTTSDGHIWVGYADEGVYGNLGWTMKNAVEMQD